MKIILIVLLLALITLSYQRKFDGPISIVINNDNDESCGSSCGCNSCNSCKREVVPPCYGPNCGQPQPPCVGPNCGSQEKCECSCQNNACVCKQPEVNGVKCSCPTQCGGGEEEKCSCSCSNGNCVCQKDTLSNGQKCSCSETCKKEESCSCQCFRGVCTCDKKVLSNGTVCKCSENCKNGCSCQCKNNKCMCDKPVVNGKRCTCSKKCDEKCDCQCRFGHCMCKKPSVNGKICTCSETCKKTERCDCACRNGKCVCAKKQLSNGTKCECTKKCEAGCNCNCVNGQCKCDKPSVNGKTCSCPQKCTEEEKCSCNCQNGQCKCLKDRLKDGTRCSCSTPCGKEERCNCNCSNGKCQCDKNQLSDGTKCTCRQPCASEEKCSCRCVGSNCQCDKNQLSDGTTCRCKETCGPRCVTRWYPNFGQCDPRWGRLKYNSQYSFCDVGCLVVAVANYLNGFGIKINGQTADPGVLHQYILAHGGYVNNYSFPFYMMTNLGLKYLGLHSTSKWAQVKRYICDGYLVAILIKKNPNTRNRWHFVLATSVNSDDSINVKDNWENNRPLYTKLTQDVVQEYYVYQPPQ